MKNDTTILPFRQSESIADPFTELAREGARRMLAKALALNLHRQLEGAGEHPGEITRAGFDQLFQDCLNRSIHSLCSMVGLQLHGIPEWAYRTHRERISRRQVTVPARADRRGRTGRGRRRLIWQRQNLPYPDPRTRFGLSSRTRPLKWSSAACRGGSVRSLPKACLQHDVEGVLAARRRSCASSCSHRSIPGCRA